MSNISALKQQAEILLERMTSGKRFLLGDLNVRIAQAREDHPGDSVIHAVGHVVERLHEKDPSGIISQADLEHIYQELVGLNSSGTKFREVLGDILPSQIQPNTHTNKDYVSGMRDEPERGEIGSGADAELSPELQGLFSNASDKYNPQQAVEAQYKVEAELSSMGYSPKVNLMGGNSQFLIFAADLDTRNGKVRVQIPVEASGDQFPTAFISHGEVKQLTTSFLNEHLERAASTKSQGKHYQDTIDMPQVPVPEELKFLSTAAEESVLEASVGFPQASVRLAKKMVLTELSSMGFKGSQLRVAEPTNDGFICEATINTATGKTTIEIPVDFKNDLPLLPSVFAKDDYIAAFDAQSLHAFASRGEYAKAGVAIREDNPLFTMSLFELKDCITRFASDGNYDECDEVFEVISQRFDEGTYRSAISDYQKILVNLATSKETVAQAYDDSDQFVKSPNSMYPLHKKLGRPINELVRDEHGQYHLKSTYHARQNQEQEGAFFSTAKALIGD